VVRRLAVRVFAAVPARVHVDSDDAETRQGVEEPVADLLGDPVSRAARLTPNRDGGGTGAGAHEEYTL
jgi:hypothetical protein